MDGQIRESSSGNMKVLLECPTVSGNSGFVGIAQERYTFL